MGEYMKDLSGCYNRKVDSLYRIRIPKIWLKEAPFHIVFGGEKVAQIISKNILENMCKKFNTNLDNVDMMEALSFFISSFYDLEVDAKGRVSLPLNFVERLEIKKEVVLIGKDDKIILISKERFDEGIDKLLDAELYEFARL